MIDLLMSSDGFGLCLFIFWMAAALLVFKKFIHDIDELAIPEARGYIDIIREFTPSNKALNKKSMDVDAIASNVINILTHKSDDIFGKKLYYDTKNTEKIKALSDTHLSKIAQSIQIYKRVERGQLDSHDYPGIEAELDALLDAAKADLILESKSLFKPNK